MSEVNTIKTTTAYDKFSLLDTNRDTIPKHVTDLEESVRKYPFLLLIQPVLVNERFQIIDGQHHYEVAKRLKKPFAYAQVPKIGIELARLMNIKQAPWQPLDYAKSYASEGNKHYVTYLKFREDYPYNHSLMILFLADSHERGGHKRFKEGLFEINSEEKARKLLDQIDDIRNELDLKYITDAFGTALFNAFNHADFDFDHFIGRIKDVGKVMFHPAAGIEDYMRLIESIYNYKLSTNQIRLF